MAGRPTHQAMPAPRLICAAHTISGAMPGATARHGFDDRVAAVAAASFDGIAIHFRDHARLVAEGADPGALRACVTKAGLSVPEVEFLSDWHGPNRDADAIAQAIATARHFGAERLNVGADIADAGLPPAAMAEDFRRLCGQAGDSGIQISLEVLAWGGISTLDAAQDLVAAGAGNAGLLIDSWHIFRAPGIGLERLRALDPACVSGIQINDAGPVPQGPAQDDTRARLFPGEGSFDLVEFLRILWRPALSTGVSVEVIAPAVAAMDLAAAARQSHDSARNLIATVQTGTTTPTLQAMGPDA